MSFLKELLWLLPSGFTKKVESNVGKILKLAADNYGKISDNLHLQLDWKNISVAEGYALDEIGAMVGLPRGTYTDEMYRIRIKTRIAQNLSDGTINGVIETLSASLDIDLRDIQIDTLWQSGKPATIRITKIPVTALNKAGMTQEELIEIVKVIIASGIDVESVELIGTFRFSKNYDVEEINANTGFYDEATGQGGYFGEIMDVGGI